MGVSSAGGKGKQRRQQQHMSSILPVAFFAIFSSLACCNFCCASLMASLSDWEFDRDLNKFELWLWANKGIGGGGGGGGAFVCEALSAVSPKLLALSLSAAFSCRNSASELSARILEISSSVIKSLTWIFKDSISVFKRSSISLSKFARFSVHGVKKSSKVFRSVKEISD